MKENVRGIMISKESQVAVDNMTAGYIQMIAGLKAEVTEPGNVWVNKKFAGTHNVNVATDREGIVVLITDDDDPSTIVEEIYDDLGEAVNRIIQINELSEEDEEDN
jgi:hypothetical protein